MRIEYLIITALILVIVFLIVRTQKIKNDSFQDFFNEFLQRFSKVVDELNDVKLDSSRHTEHINSITADLNEIKQSLNNQSRRLSRIDKKNGELIHNMRTFSNELNDVKFDCKHKCKP